MKYFKMDLLTLLVSLFIFSSCEKDGTIGLDIAPQDSIKSIFTDTITVTTVTVRDDSVATTNLTNTPLGYLQDPIFGTTEANLALGLQLPSDNFSFGANATLDSAVLVLRYGNKFYGDSITSRYFINVHQLGTVFDASKNHYNTATWPKNLSEIGGLDNWRRFIWYDSTYVNTIVDNGPDVVRAVAPQLRIPINANFVRDNILQADDNKLKNDIVFSNYIKGLYVTIDKSLSTGNGGIAFFDLQSAVSGLQIYYKNTNGSAIDTNVVTFPVVGASEIKRNNNYTGTPIQTQLQNQNQSYSTVYVQPMAGLRARIFFPYISKLKAMGNIAINKAELVVPVVSEANGPLKPAPRLTFYSSDIAGQRQFTVDNLSLSSNLFGGFYNLTNQNYTFNITSFIQNLINNPTTQYPSYLGVIDNAQTTSTTIAPSAATAARSILGGQNHPQSPIRLRIYYTKPN
jgi:hypothetical protein